MMATVRFTYWLEGEGEVHQEFSGTPVHIPRAGELVTLHVRDADGLKEQMTFKVREVRHLFFDWTARAEVILDRIPGDVRYPL